MTEIKKLKKSHARKEQVAAKNAERETTAKIIDGFMKMLRTILTEDQCSSETFCGLSNLSFNEMEPELWLAKVLILINEKQKLTACKAEDRDTVLTAALKKLVSKLQDARSQTILKAAEAKKKKEQWEKLSPKDAAQGQRRAENVGAYEERARGAEAQAETLEAMVAATSSSVAQIVSLIQRTR